MTKRITLLILCPNLQIPFIGEEAQRCQTNKLFFFLIETFLPLLDSGAVQIEKKVVREGEDLQQRATV